RHLQQSPHPLSAHSHHLQPFLPMSSIRSEGYDAPTLPNPRERGAPANPASRSGPGHPSNGAIRSAPDLRASRTHAKYPASPPRGGVGRPLEGCPGPEEASIPAPGKAPRPTTQNLYARQPKRRTQRRSTAAKEHPHADAPRSPATDTAT